MGITWPWNAFRICCTITAVLVFDQSVFAGQLLSGSFGALHTHRENATYAGLAALASAVTGLAVRWRAGGPWWPAAACGGLFVLIAVQIAVGFARALTVHVPLGVAIIVLTVLVTLRAWRSPAGRAGGGLPSTAEAKLPPSGTAAGPDRARSS